MKVLRLKSFRKFQKRLHCPISRVKCMTVCIGGLTTSSEEMVSRTLCPCSHGWVDECASPPHLVTSSLLQSPADVLKTQQSVLTVFPRVRPHPSLFNIVSMGIQKSRHHSTEFHLTWSAAQNTGKYDESIFGNKFEYYSPELSLPSKALWFRYLFDFFHYRI